MGITRRDPPRGVDKTPVRVLAGGAAPSPFDIRDPLSPVLRWWEDEQALDEKGWRMYVDGKVFFFQTLNDANSVAETIWEVVRGAGTAITAINVRKPWALSRTSNRFFSLDADGKATIRFDDNSRPVLLHLINADGTVTTHGISIDWSMGTAQGGTPIGAARLIIRPKQGWTATATTQDTVAELQLTVDGALATMLTMDDTKAQFAKWVMDPGSAITSVDQTAFANAQTNITGLSFPVGTNETYQVDIVLSATMVSTAGVKFYFTTPAGVTGEMHIEGNVAGLNTWQSLHQAVLTVPGTFFVTGAITGTVRIRATVRTTGNSGTVQLVGITGAAGTTCTVKKGSSLLATRHA